MNRNQFKRYAEYAAKIGRYSVDSRKLRITYRHYLGRTRIYLFWNPVVGIPRAHLLKDNIIIERKVGWDAIFLFEEHTGEDITAALNLELLLDEP